MYRGREGQWAWALNRLSGLAILLYLFIHVVSIGSFIFGEDAYMTIHRAYSLWPFSVGLLLLTAGVLYHSLNGLRVIIMDFTGRGLAYQRQLWYAVLLLSVAGTAYAAAIVLPRIIEFGGSR